MEQELEMPKPVFEVGPESYVDHLWFAGNEEMDIMGLLYRDSKTSPWRLTYRFRYYNSSDPFDPKDKKNVYQLTAPDSDDAHRDQVFEVFEKIIQGSKKVLGEDAQIVSVPVKGNSEVFEKVLLKQNFAHVKSIPKESETIH